MYSYNFTTKSGKTISVTGNSGNLQNSTFTFHDDFRGKKLSFTSKTARNNRNRPDTKMPGSLRYFIHYYAKAN